MKLEIIFENSKILVLNKPTGLVVNRSQTIKEETLQDKISKYLKLPKGDLGIGDRVGIVHRLDRETSGLMVIAKTQRAYVNLQAQFKNRDVKKEYVALVHGFVKGESLNIKNEIGRIGAYGKFGVMGKRQQGKEAETEIERITNYKLPLHQDSGQAISNFQNLVSGAGFNKVRQRYLDRHACDYTLVEAHPKTGRTHQIRVHLKSTGHPLVSDLIYTPSKLLKFDLLWCPRLFLHAKRLTLVDPQTSKKLTFDCDLPKDLKSAMLFLERNV